MRFLPEGSRRLAEAGALHLLLFLGRGRRIGAINRLGLFGTRAAIRKAWLDVDVGVLAHLGQILAHGRLHPAHVKGLLHFLLDILIRRNAAGDVFSHFEDDVPLLGANRFGKLAGFQRECLIFEHLGQAAAFELAQIAPLGGRWAVAEGLCQLAEVTAGMKPGRDVVGFGLGRGQFFRIIGLYGSLFDNGGGRRADRYKNLA